MSVTKVTGMMQTGTKGGDIPSAGALVIDTDGDYFDITGTTGITSMTVAAGRIFTLQFDGVVTLTHSSNLYLNGAVNFTTEAFDHLTFIAVAANDVRQIGAGLKDGGSPIISTATDLTPIRQDIAMLALYNAVSDNRGAYNLPNSFIDQFEDDSGITTETTVDRDPSGEYVASIITRTVDANVSFLGHMDTSSLVDSSLSPRTTTLVSPAAYSTAQKQFGTGAYYAEHVSASLTIADSSMWDTGTGDFTWEAWIRTTDASRTNQQIISCFNNGTGTDSNSYLRLYGGNLEFVLNGVVLTSTFSVSSDTWYHVAAERTSATAMHVYMGAAGGTNTITTGSGGASYNLTTDYLSIGNNVYTDANKPFFGYIDEVRISNVARYGGSAFTPDSSAAFYSSIATATGTLISDTQTAPTATTKMSGVILYKDNAGTATLGTDLKIYLSANGGTNYTEVASYGTVTALFSTGVKMVRLGETTVTSGTTPVIKAVWANQSSGSKETQLHGWAMNY